MGLPKLAALLAAIAATAAVLTRPGPDEVEAALREALYRQLFTTEVDTGRDMPGNAAILGCRIGPQLCYDLLRAGLEVTFEDRILFARVSVEGFGRRAVCFGAFGRFACPAGFAPLPDR